MSDSAAGWQPDPTGKHDHRYWDGDGWTDHVADGGVAGSDPYEAPGAAEPTVVTPVAGVEDTTASYPTATTPPGAAPPYVPPMPAAGGGDNGGGGASKRGLVIGGAILAAVAIAVVAFLAFSGDDDDDPTTPVAGETEDTTTTEDTDGDGGEGTIGNDGFAGDEARGPHRRHLRGDLRTEPRPGGVPGRQDDRGDRGRLTHRRASVHGGLRLPVATATSPWTRSAAEPRGAPLRGAWPSALAVHRWRGCACRLRLVTASAPSIVGGASR